MSALIFSPASRHAGSGARLLPLAAAKTFVEEISREWRLRRAIREVGALDEAMLHDMGVAPGGIEHAVRQGRGDRAERGAAKA